MPVRLDWLIVRLVGEVELIETVPLATVPPVGRDCASDGCAQPRPHNSATTLTEVSNLLKADPSLKLQVSGHTDNSGTKDHNITLSKGRAEAVVAALVGQYQVAANRLVAEGFGDSKPVAPNDSAANMAKNRRVELRKI